MSAHLLSLLNDAHVLLAQTMIHVIVATSAQSFIRGAKMTDIYWYPMSTKLNFFLNEHDLHEQKP